MLAMRKEQKIENLHPVHCDERMREKKKKKQASDEQELNDMHDMLCMKMNDSSLERCNRAEPFSAKN